MNREQFRFLDGLRGIAALYVVIGHARWLLWEGYSEGYLQHPELYPFPARLLMYGLSLFSYGHAMVIFFFVLSGFVIHLRYSNDIKCSRERATFDWWKYCIRRVRRIYPPLLMALLITLGMDLLGKSLEFPIYSGLTPYRAISNVLTFNHDFMIAIGTLAGFPGIPSWGSNGALWSLKYELWFYAMYPLFWWLSRHSVSKAALGVISAFLIGILPNILLDHGDLQVITIIFSYMAIWCFGAFLADVYTGRINIKLWKVSLLSLSIPLLLFVERILNSTTNSPAEWLIQDMIWALGFTGILAMGLMVQRRGGSLRFLEIFKPLGDFSYTLYVFHLPILVFISGYLMSQSSSLPRFFEWVLLGVLIAVVVSYLAHFVVERPFTKHSKAASILVPEPQSRRVKSTGQGL